MKTEPKMLQPQYSWLSWGMKSLPMASFLGNVTMDEMLYSSMCLRVKDPDNHHKIDALAEELAPMGGILSKTYENGKSTKKIKRILDKVFYGLIGVTMFLCYFSLSASMSANLYEQKKEVGVLRAIGFTKYRVRMLYFYEALILVFTSCLLGIIIGTVVGYTMLL